MMEAELQLRIPKMWLTEIPMRHEVSLKIVERKSSGKSGVRDLVEMTGSLEQLERVRTDIRSDPWVKSSDLDYVESGKLVGEVVTHKCLACSILAGSDCFLISASAKSDGSVTWRVMASDREKIRKLMAKLKKAKCDAELLRLTPIDEREVLTGRQEEIIMIAFERGFFETPRKIKLKDLSKIMGVSQATLSEILRKGQKRIVVDFLRARQKTL